MGRGLAIVVACAWLAASGCRDIAGYAAFSSPLEADRGSHPSEDRALPALDLAPLDQAPPSAEQPAVPDKGPAPWDEGPAPDLRPTASDKSVPRDKGAPSADKGQLRDKGASADKSQPRDKGAPAMDAKAADAPPPPDCSDPVSWTCDKIGKLCQATCLPYHQISCTNTGCTCYRDGAPVSTCVGAGTACGACVSMQTIGNCCAM